MNKLSPQLPGKARQKIILFILIFTIFITFIPSLLELNQTEREGFHSFPSLLPTPVSASEEENVDSFQVDPESTRWNVIEDTFVRDPVVTNGILNISETGDGSTNQYRIERGLRKNDGKVVFRFRQLGRTGAYSSSNFLFIGMAGTTGLGNNVLLSIFNMNSTGFLETNIRYINFAGTNEILVLTGSELLVNDTWYIFEIKYNQLKSQLRYTVSFDNGSRVFRYDWQDISSNQPGLFQDETRFTVISPRVTESGEVIETHVDYCEAPFKEQEWTQINTPGDPDFRVVSWEAYEVRGVVNQDTAYGLIVPYFDSVSGKMFTDPSITFTAGDFIHAEFTLQGIDGDDGGAHDIMTISIQYTNILFPSILLIDGLAAIPFALASPAGPASEASVQFSFALTEDRSKVQLKANVDTDGTGALAPIQLVWEGSVSTYVTDPSNEFRLVTFIDAQLDNAGDDITYALQDFGFQTRDIFAELVQPIIDGIFAFLAWIWAEIIRFLGGIFKIVGDLIVAALVILEVAFQVAIAALEATFTVVGALIEAAIEALEPFLTVIRDAVDALWTLLIATLDDIFDTIVTVLTAIISDLIDLAAAVLFFFWDAIGLPDVLAFISATLTRVVEAIDWIATTIPQVILWFLDVSIFIFVAWWIACIPIQFAKARFEPMGGIAFAIEFYFNNAFPISILGFEIYVPQGVIFTFWALAILPANFAIFTALP